MSNKSKDAIRDYLKCIWANKFCVAGYAALLVLISIVSFLVYFRIADIFWQAALGLISVILILVVLLAFLVTELGYITFVKYRQTKKILEVRPHSRDSLIALAQRKDYCGICGVALALKEYKKP